MLHSCFYLQFKELTYGLQKTNASTLLRSCLEYVMNHYSRILPGEGGFLLDLLQDVRFNFDSIFIFLPLWESERASLRNETWDSWVETADFWKALNSRNENILSFSEAFHWKFTQTSHHMSLSPDFEVMFAVIHGLGLKQRRGGKMLCSKSFLFDDLVITEFKYFCC